MTSNTPSLSEATDWALPSRLVSHRGRVTFRIGEDNYAGEAEFIVPADGHAILGVHDLAGEPSQDFGADLLVVGDSASGPFRLECQGVYVTPSIAPGVVGRDGLPCRADQRDRAYPVWRRPKATRDGQNSA